MLFNAIALTYSICWIRFVYGASVAFLAMIFV
jgi:hypothetical protein